MKYQKRNVKIVKQNINVQVVKDGKIMGDRISISFKDDQEESIVFFEHHAGLRLKKGVEAFIKEIDKKYEKNDHDPYSRREASAIMPVFIAWYANKNGIDYNVYLGATKDDGDNSDNGHFVFDLVTGKWE
jgi:hypothetical protein